MRFDARGRGRYVCWYGPGAPEVSRIRRLPLCDSKGSFQSKRCPFESGQALMEPVALSLRTTSSLSAFKKMMGQNNHFLITILVGLDHVGKGEATLSPEFSTTWSPINPSVSARRSREFAIKALLAWAADSLDTYRRLLTTPPDVYLSTSECDAVRDVQGLWPRLLHLSNLSGAVLGAERDLVQLLVIWRNKVVHTAARDAIPGDLRRALMEKQEEIASSYCGLDIQRALTNLDEGEAPAFKEITALVSAAHHFAHEMDRALVSRVDPDRYLRTVLSVYIRENAITRSQNIWGRDPARRRASILQVAQNHGMSAGDATRPISGEFLHELASWTPKEARKELLQD